MLIYLADDEPLLLDDLNDAVHEAEPSAKIKTFSRGKALINEVRTEKDKPQVIFMDIEMPGMSGIELAKELKNLSPSTRLVFVTGFRSYAVEAFSVRADGYMMKPVSAEKIREELDHLRPVLGISPPKRIRAQCFGNFEVFLDGEPIRFQYSKTRELMAYLVSRNGALCSNGEIMAALWEDKSNDGYVRRLRSDLHNQLDINGLGRILVQQRGLLGILEDEIDCDYYDWLAGKQGSDNIYQGEYMSQYSWAETICGTLRK